jgi:hypothetical protein
MSKNGLLSKDGGTVLGEMLKVNTVLKELDVSSSGDGMPYGTSDGPGFAKELAVGIKGNGAISSINLLKNEIPVEQAQELVKIMQVKDNLTTLCGLSREETKLDFSGQWLGAGDAVLIANDISDMGALSTFTFSGIYSSEPVTMEITMTEADFSGKGLGVSGGMMVAAFLPKCQ